MNKCLVHTAPWPPHGRVAFLMSNALGDCLVSMVMVDNMVRHGVDVRVFGDTVHALRTWFPRATIEPMPTREALPARLASFHTVFQVHRAYPVANLMDLHPGCMLLEDVVYEKGGGGVAERLAAYCLHQWGWASADIGNGACAPPGLHYRRYRQRVVIHPESSWTGTRWLACRFVRLAHRLRARGYDVHFVIAPHERERWAGLDAHGIPAPRFENLDLLARWIHESGWFIGNDSGIGHLASSVGIPTVTLFRRRGVAQRWRHAWGITEPVLPWQWLPSAALKNALWRHTLTCGRVLAAFSALEQRDAAQSRGE